MEKDLSELEIPVFAPYRIVTIKDLKDSQRRLLFPSLSKQAIEDLKHVKIIVGSISEYVNSPLHSSVYNPDQKFFSNFINDCKKFVCFLSDKGYFGDRCIEDIEIDNKVLEFVKKYGLLGFGKVIGAVRAVDWCTDQFSDPDKPYEILRLRVDGVFTDMLYDFLECLRIITILIYLLSSPDDDYYKKIAPFLIGSGSQKAERYVFLADDGSESVFADTPSFFSPDSIQRRIADYLNCLCGGQIKIYFKPEKNYIKQAILPETLLEVLVHYFYEMTVQKTSFRECENPRCKKTFEATHKSQIYCPPPDEHSKISPCGNRHRQQKFKRKKRAENKQEKNKMTLP